MLDAAFNADLVEEIRTEIANDTLQLTTLSEGALQIRDEVEKDSTDANKIAAIVGATPAGSKQPPVSWQNRKRVDPAGRARWPSTQHRRSTRSDQD